MTINRFEDLEVWQLARQLSKDIFQITLLPPFVSDYKFRDQIRASSGSIMDNIAEGFGRGGNKEFINYLNISRGSCNETRSQCYRAFDFSYISDETLNTFLAQTDLVSFKILAFIRYLKASDRKGPKYE